MTSYGEEVRRLADPRLAGFNSGLIPGKGGILGVRIPDLRRLARRIAREDWRGFLEEVPGSHEEELLRGIVIGYAPVGTEERIALSDAYIPTIDNWAACDTFCASWRCPPGDEDLVWDYFSRLMDDGREYPMRVSLVARMSMFDDRGRMEALAEDIMSHDNRGYYYRMGAAWTASVVYTRFPDVAVGMLGSGRMEPWTRDRTIRKICESRRVTAEERAAIRALGCRAP